MAADVFETYAVSLIGALLLGTLNTSLPESQVVALTLPFLLGGIAIIGSILCGKQDTLKSAPGSSAQQVMSFVP